MEELCINNNIESHINIKSTHKEVLKKKDSFETNNEINHHSLTEESLNHTFNTLNQISRNNKKKTIDVSERPLLCSSYNKNNNEIVFGSSDHALYTIDLEKGDLSKILYTKKYGHEEWVTCVTHLRSNVIVSGGMDSKICVWNTTSKNKEIKCIDLIGHEGSISALSSFTDTIISTSYDKTVRLWRCDKDKGKEMSKLEGHKSSIITLGDKNKHIIATGDRKGYVYIWDLITCMYSWRLRNIHKGHVTTLKWKHDINSNISNVFISGGQDGILRMWDLRNHSNLSKDVLHVNQHGKGAISDVIIPKQNENQIISVGADKCVKILDIRNNGHQLNLIKEFEMTDFVYKMKEFNNYILCTCGDGMIFVIDREKEEIKFKNKISDNAMRCIEITNNNNIICGGDDGYIAIY